MKIKYGELEDLFFNIKDIITFIEGTKYETRRFKLHLSNGDHLNFFIPNEAVAHLLGINTMYLQSTRLFNSTNSFELLKELIDNAYRIQDAESRGIINYDRLFSPYIFDKVNHFKENIKIDTTEVEFICKYDKEKTYIISDNFQKYNYIIVKRLENGKIGLLCLVRNEGYFAPMSNQVYDDFESVKEKLKELLKFQEITLISGITVSNTLTDYYQTHSLNLHEKANKIKNLKIYKEEFCATIDVAHDFSYSIGKLKQHKITDNENDRLIQQIVESIKNGKIINTNNYTNSTLIPIINAFNDFICSNEFKGNNNNKKTYSELIKKLTEFEERIEELSNEKNKLNDENKKLLESNISLNKENDQLKENEEAIIKILKPRIN